MPDLKNAFWLVVLIFLVVLLQHFIIRLFLLNLRAVSGVFAINNAAAPEEKEKEEPVKRKEMRAATINLLTKIVILATTILTLYLTICKNK